MIAVDRGRVLLAVPVGKDNAVGATKIAETMSLWSLTTIKRHLVALVASGKIQSRSIRAPRHRDVTVYYRPSDRDECQM
jgi:hypothetical protein